MGRLRERFSRRARQLMGDLFSFLFFPFWSLSSLRFYLLSVLCREDSDQETKEEDLETPQEEKPERRR